VPEAIQSKFESLRKTITNDLWTGKPNEWIRNLSTADAGRIGEELAQGVLGGTLMPNTKSGYDLELGEMKIEVKTATLSIANEKKIFAWMAIRPTDPYTHICFIAIYPDDVRLFLVPREDMPIESFPLANSRGDRKMDIRQFLTRRTSTLVPWMARHEVFQIQQA
jgi:hypothetical protein